MRLLTTLAATLALTACGGDYWMSEPQKDSMRATESVVRERIVAGKMTEAEGQMVIAQQRAAFENQNRAAGAAYFGGRSGVYQPVGGGTVIKY
jgi:hypothetical protein